jgi:hypothetical protein
MKYITVLLVVSAMVLTAQSENDLRIRNFPKEEIIRTGYPKKENTWVFLMAGQSNMAGRGFVEPQDTLSHERILTINSNGTLIHAKEPIHFYEPVRAGLDCGLSFGRELLDHIPDSIQIILIPTAVGGSSVSQWLGDSTKRSVRLLTNFTEKAAIGITYGTVKGVLWHQGESDANTADLPFYKERLKKLFQQFREIIGNEQLPVILGELGTYSEKKEFWAKINDLIHSYSLGDPYTAVVSTSDLVDKGDKEHFNAEGQRTLGKRYAEAFLRMMK